MTDTGSTPAGTGPANGAAHVHADDFSRIRAVAQGVTPAPTAQGLRERKKQLTRTLLSDTAMAMFLQRGFDEVRVAEIAEACGVSEKTVYNYFPSKEALLLDEEADMADAIRGAAFTTDTSPVDAMLGVLESRMRGLTAAFDEQGGAPAMTLVGRFSDIVEGTPSLRAHHRDTVDRLVTVAAHTLAHRAGLPPDDPELQVAAFALIALWRVQIQSLQRHADGVRTPHQVADLVLADLHRAAQLTDTGLHYFWRTTPSAGHGGVSRHPQAGDHH